MEVDSTNFFQQLPVPDKFTEKNDKICNFVSKHNEIGNKVVLVTSGGTTVPLESRTVRYMDNFSQGTRGSASAENFLQHGYAVIFLYRNRSLEPYSRHFSRLNLLDMLEFANDNTSAQSIVVQQEYEDKVKTMLLKYKEVMKSGHLLFIDFTTLNEYLHLLRASALSLQQIGHSAMLYLAAAVSDFYIPKDQMPEHKIQSADGPLHVSLQLVPKLLGPLVKEWAPDAFVISFKLETDKNLLIKKAEEALKKYHHQLVIANVLETRKQAVVIVSKDSIQTISLSKEQLLQGIEIEEHIVTELSSRHNKMMNEK